MHNFLKLSGETHISFLFPDAEMELDISHDAGVGVGKGEVADVGAVLLREIVRMDVPALATGKGPLDDLT